ncbi:hypothetical protein [Arthrobacter sp. ISL-69]|uniref:hypothetical protein n=1 Tax=Arthrobacter sp. ISL-69 TaxID=2819113 RepID=UPI001BEB4F1C|nr:hypothetical protein [Arthrobacter sp. ISL-69]MBT2534617.1 hypothetical protein [Arthrobacter sp. ISL-69]
MDPALINAIVAAAVAVVVAFITSVASWKVQRNQARDNERLALQKDQLDADGKFQERQVTARTEVDRIREPLLNAARDLLHRIWNIRENGFSYYLNGEGNHRSEVALLGTLHRFARYRAIQEFIYSRINLLRFELDPDTRQVAAIIDSIASTLASDRADGLHLIFWREEQRAVAELMMDFHDTTASPQFMGFASFRRTFREDEMRERKEGLALWFSDFARDLQTASISESRRLKQLQDKLTLLIEELEKGRMSQLKP